MVRICCDDFRRNLRMRRRRRRFDALQTVSFREQRQQHNATTATIDIDIVDCSKSLGKEVYRKGGTQDVCAYGLVCEV